MENKEKEIVNQDTKELITRYLENFNSINEYKALLNILATTSDEDFINLLKQCNLKEFDIFKLMGIITTCERGDLTNFQMLMSVSLSIILRQLEISRINDLINAIKLGSQKEYLAKLSIYDKTTLISFIKNRKILFDGLDEYDGNTLDKIADEAIKLITASVFTEPTEEKKECIQDKQKTL